MPAIDLGTVIVEFLRWGGGRVGWVGLHSHFHVQPNCGVQVVLCCVVVWVVTIYFGDRVPLISLHF